MGRFVFVIIRVREKLCVSVVINTKLSREEL